MEVLYLQIRTVNRAIEYGRASYGFSDGAGPPGRPLDNSPAHAARDKRLDEGLEELETMVERGEISQKA